MAHSSRMRWSGGARSPATLWKTSSSSSSSGLPNAALRTTSHVRHVSISPSPAPSMRRLIKALSISLMWESPSAASSGGLACLGGPCSSLRGRRLLSGLLGLVAFVFSDMDCSSNSQMTLREPISIFLGRLLITAQIAAPPDDGGRAPEYPLIQCDDGVGW